MSAMTCPDRDQDLLLLSHGALPFWPRLATVLHLRRCAQCRDRLEALTRTSAVLAAAVRGPDLPAWSHSHALSRTALPIPFALIVLSAAVLIAAILLMIRPVIFPSQRPASLSVIGGCRPDLPNSRCR